ncbi:hypothetical protein [Leptospira borgpetersenii]|uniref:Lipoprotein n=1 Tax=Leptospira borgpetersenii serovar Ballum TaxID=280505 RepID=A0A0E3B702_LEPBO|nr:hypothetical protein [Leptospira borgpetersenii]EMO08005.1 hypothetical protein LEP1GSC137_1136 [Leptospira borgpetersenii str. Noumea 25]ALO27940.1 hypothetical protein LBBP_03773 [Leptospira borgpetersenii serovar Ballum]ANH02129.1 Uncharacterized protein LB4E_2960 [Leptospira borgpetersenii str. 4E]EKR00182.1 hypothetical protein LEP1GSC121_3563 [Leptospira borgpetersenii serovar Castellonis str. 200801910]KGE26248.1 hypothetical protein IQ66_02580 [Leptospira borgpetersenii serovar Ball
MNPWNIPKFAWTLFLFGFGCATNYNNFDKRIYIVEGLKKQNIQEEKIPEKRKHTNVLNSSIVTIKEGVGILELVIDKTRFTEVESKFGNQYARNHFNFEDVEIHYESLGLSFIFDDYRENIREIGIQPPFLAITSKGIVLGKSTLQEVIDVYGKAADISGEYAKWGVEKELYLCIRYGFKHSFRGIKFCVEKNPSIPEYDPANKTFYLKQKIQKIYLF